MLPVDRGWDQVRQRLLTVEVTDDCALGSATPASS